MIGRCCYMSHQDYNLFENLFKGYGIAKRVVYSTMRKFSEDDLQTKSKSKNPPAFS